MRQKERTYIRNEQIFATYRVLFDNWLMNCQYFIILLDFLKSRRDEMPR